MQDKKPRNENGQPHGKWEVFRINGELWYTFNYVNGFRYGYGIILNRDKFYFCQ